MAEIFLRSILALYGVAAFVFSIYYLRYRRCTKIEFVFWGALAFFVPVLGPFFVIAARPGPKKRVRRPRLGHG
jgi:hypothetical protein